MCGVASTYESLTLSYVTLSTEEEALDCRTPKPLNL